MTDRPFRPYHLIEEFGTPRAYDLGEAWPWPTSQIVCSPLVPRGKVYVFGGQYAGRCLAAYTDLLAWHEDRLRKATKGIWANLDARLDEQRAALHRRLDDLARDVERRLEENAVVHERHTDQWGDYYIARRGSSRFSYNAVMDRDGVRATWSKAGAS